MTIYGEQLLAFKYCRISSDGQTGRTKISVCWHFYNFNVKNATDSFSGIISTKTDWSKKIVSKYIIPRLLSNLLSKQGRWTSMILAVVQMRSISSIQNVHGQESSENKVLDTLQGWIFIHILRPILQWANLWLLRDTSAVQKIHWLMHAPLPVVIILFSSGKGILF